jgi:GNAT superfamily N-acetyltransferase
VNRDELLDAVFGKPEDELPSPAHWFTYFDPDRQGHVLSLVGLGWRRLVIRDSQPAGSEMTVATTTIQVAAIMNVCTDPDHRGQGYATLQMLAALEAAESHELTKWAALFCGPELVPFYEQFEFYRPGVRDPELMVCDLQGERWPDGEVMIREKW